MSVPNENRRNDYVGNGAVSAYAYSFRIMHKSHLKVVVYNPSTKLHTTLAEGTNYTVSGVGETGGGQITLLGAYAPLPSTHLLAIILQPPLTQTSDIRNDDSYYQDAQEDDHDRRVYQVLRLSEGLDRAYKLPESEAGTAVATTLPRAEERANKFWSFDGSGNPKMEPGVNLAPLDPQYVVIGLHAGLPNERVLTSVANGISVVDGGAGGTVTLTLPQALHTAATPQFAEVRLGGANRVLTADADDVLAVKRGTNAQELRIYGTTTGPKYISISHDGTNGVLFTNSGPLYLGANASTRWLIDLNGHLIGVTHNTYDVGSATNAPRDLYWGRQAIGSTGSAAAPSYTITGNTSWGFYWDAVNTCFGFSAAGTQTYALHDTAFILANGAQLYFSGGAVGSFDVALARDASGVLAQRIGGGAQEFRVYGTTTGPKYVSLRHTGTVGRVATNDTARLELGTSNAARWYISQSGTGWLEPAVDNTYDVGSGSLRVRYIVWGTQALGPTAVNAYSFAAETNSGLGLPVAGTVRLQVAGTTAMDWTASYVAVLANDLYLGSASDVRLARDAANVLAQRNGANAQTFRVYGNTTGPFYSTLRNDGTNAILEAAGTGSALYFGSAATLRWLISSSGHFQANADNTYDIGAIGALRPRAVYIASILHHGGAGTPTLGFFGVAGVSQQAGIADADGTLADITTKFNSLLAKMEAYGLLTVV